MKKKNAVFATVLSLITGGIAGAVIYLAFIYPKTLAVWVQEDRTLSASQMLMANVSSFCASYGLRILPIFLIGFLASLLWLILTVIK